MQSLHHKVVIVITITQASDFLILFNDRLTVLSKS